MHFFDSMNFFSGPAATRWAALFMPRFSIEMRME
jgi:hypothetical protein